MADLLRVSIVGVMPSGEEWSVNPVYSIGGDFGVTVTPAQATTIATAIAALTPGGPILAAMASGTGLAGCRVEARAMDGTLETQAEAMKAVIQYGTGAGPHPFQTSIVWSLRTAAVGGSGRGRLYWPATGQALEANTYRISNANAVLLVNSVAAYLAAIEAAIEATVTGVALAVWSRTKNELNLVQTIQVGNVLDTQRRRRDALLESYSNAAYTA